MTPRSCSRTTLRALVASVALAVCASLAGPPATAAPAAATPRAGTDVDAGPMRVVEGADPGAWSVPDAPSVATDVVRWTAPRALPYADARPEVRLDGRTVAYASETADPTVLTVPVDALEAVVATEVAAGRAAPTTEDLELWLGGRRLDGPTPTSVGADLPTQTVRSTPTSFDPAAPGPYETETVDYRARPMPWSAYAAPVEVLGHAVLPAGVEDAPVVLILHGRHAPCYTDEPPVGDRAVVAARDWPCPGASQPIPSHLGYDYLQRRLASQGYATVSISANAINAQDYRSSDGGSRARAALVDHHLRLLVRRASTPGDTFEGRLDPDRVVLVGHSRGGEGVNQAAASVAADAPYDVVGQVPIAPTDFSGHAVPFTPTVLLLPYCDGDVSDLQGQMMVDNAVGLTPGARDTAFRSSLLIRGANHNFFNTEWTPGVAEAPSQDDWYDQDDPECGRRGSEARLTGAEQRAVGLGVVTSAVAMIAGDDTDQLALLDAVGARRTPGMPDDAAVWSHAIGGARAAFRPGGGASVGGAAVSCLAMPDLGGEARVCPDGLRTSNRDVHWMSPYPQARRSVTRRQLDLAWERPGAASAAELDLGSPRDASADGTSLDLRVVTDRSTTFDVRVVDADGTVWGQRRTLARLPGRPAIQPRWARTVRLPLGAAPAALDRTAITAVRIVPRSPEGRLWVVDGAFRTRGLPAVADVSVARIDLGSITVDEGDGPGPGIAEVPFRLRGDVSRAASFDVITRGGRSQRVEVAAGVRSGVVEVPYPRDTQNGPAVRRISLVARPATWTTAGAYLGSVRVRDDDAPPRLALAPQHQTSAYGGTARWRLSVRPEPTRAEFVRVQMSRVEGVRALRADEVPKPWLAKQLGYEPADRDLDIPLPRLLRAYPVRLVPGRPLVLRVPTRSDVETRSPSAVRVAVSVQGSRPARGTARWRPAS